MTTIYLALGTNLGDREANLTRVLTLIEQQIGQITARSRWYEYPPDGYQSDYPFLNGAIEVITSLAPFDILNQIQAIETRMGKTIRTNREQPITDRIIDVDLLIVGDTVMNTERLILPHPQLERRLFVLQPLCEIAPSLRHPVSGKTISALIAEI